MNINESNSKSTKDEIRDTGKINKISHNQKGLSKQTKAENYGCYKHLQKKRLHKKLIRRHHKIAIDRIKNELKRFRLSKLAHKNISQSDLVDIKKSGVLPVKHYKR